MNYEETILQLINDKSPLKLFIKARLKIKQQYFSDKLHRLIWKLLCKTYVITGKLPGEKVFYDIVSKLEIDDELKSNVTYRYKELTTYGSPDNDGFNYALTMLPQEYNKRMYISILTTSIACIDNKIKFSGKMYEGLEQSKQYLMARLSALQANMEVEHFNFSMMWKNFLLAKTQKKVPGILSGIDCLDNLTRGGDPGEVWILFAFAGEGKSMLTANCAYNARINQKKNIVLFIGEMNKQIYARRLLVRHSWHNKFGLEEGFLYDNIKYGKLGKEDSILYKKIIKDFISGDYGKLRLESIPMGATPEYIWLKLCEIQQEFPIDAVYIDRVELLSSTQKRANIRVELMEILQQLRQQSLDFNKGKGLFYFLVNQVGRAAWKEALKVGRYTLADGAETGEIEKTGDIVMWLLRDKDVTELQRIKFGIAKNRDGKVLPETYLKTLYERSFIGNLGKVDEVIL